MPKLKFEPVTFKNGALVLIDQRKLPGQMKLLRYHTTRAAWHAIRDMVVRGAPAIGVAAGYGVCLDISRVRLKSREAFLKALRKSADYLKTARPTAVNLAWAVDRIYAKAKKSTLKSVPDLKKLILSEARAIHYEDIDLCFRIGAHGKSLIKKGSVVLTYCNAGGLATTGYGTALAPIFEAKKQGKRFSVFSCETRPQLQGARLTMWELQKYKVPSTLICDGMVGTLMQKGKIQLVITGADRIVANGDTANKIGTYQVATLAKAHGVPFYIAAPSSTFDFKRQKGSQIPIEERSGTEITQIRGAQLAPKGIKVFNPAFDVTPHELIAGFITEKGILKPPYRKSLQCLRAR